MSKSETVAGSDDSLNINTETDNWPVPNEFKGEFDTMKTSYMVNPLKVYVGNKFIEPQEVTSVLDGALVEVHFTVKQYWINSCTPVINSFSALVQQVIVLKCS